MMKHPKLIICALFLFISTKCFSQINTFPYLENFDLSPGGWTSTSLSGSDFEHGSPTILGATGANSAPYCWGADLDSNYQMNSHSYLTSPKFYLSTLSEPYLTFFQHRFLTIYDGMYVEYSTNDTNWNLLGSYNSIHAYNWYNVNNSNITGGPVFYGLSSWNYSGFDLSSLGVNDSIRIRFAFKSRPTLNGFTPGVFIDDVSIFEKSQIPIDVSITAIISPSTYPNTTTNYPISVIIQNNSNLYIDTVISQYSIDGVSSTSQALAVGLFPNQTDTFTIGNTTFLPGNQTLCGSIYLQNDIDTTNNQFCMNIIAPTFHTLPYYEEFEFGNGSWFQTSDTLTFWEYGTPNFGLTNAAHSGVNCWDINLNTGYSYFANSILYTPLFDLTGIPLSKISFWLNYNSEKYFDGTRIEYTNDDGITWQLLGNLNDSLAQNWYNISSISSSTLPAWQSSSGGWKKSQYTLYQLQGYSSVRFRFVFTSDGAFNTDGISIDDFYIEAVPNFDARLISISTPSNNYVQGTVTAPITFSIKNEGLSNITSIYYEYYVNGVFQTSTTSSVLILPRDTIEVTLPGFILNQTNTLICGKVILLNDGDSTNNESCKTLDTLMLYSPTWSDNFNGANLGWYTENYGDSYTNWQFGTPNYGTTNNAHSGIKCWDINLSSAYGWNAHTVLYSPEFDLTGISACKISFWLNYKTESGWDGTRIEYSINHGDTWQVMGSLNDPISFNWYNDSAINSSLLPAWTNISSGWEKSSYVLYQAIGQSSLRIRFIFTSDNNLNDDGFSMDDFSIEGIPDQEVELTDISTPTSTYALGTLTDPITFNIKNFGALSATNIQYEYKVNGALLVNSTYTGVILPGESVSITLPGFIINQANSVVCGKITLLNDGDTTNNSSCKTLSGVVAIVPTWFDNFDSGNNGWYNENRSGVATNWQRGQPNYGATNSSHSSPSCWDINLNTAYTTNAHCLLYSPVFDLSTTYHPKIEFWQNYQTFQGNDGFRLEYKNGNDTNWYVLGKVNDTNAQNWFTDTLLSSSQLPSWSGNSLGWIESKYNLDSVNLADMVQFRFVFTSSVFWGAGVSIDDFLISKEFTNDAKLKSFVSPSNIGVAGSLTPVEVLLENYGSQTITSLNINYTLNGGTPLIYTWNGALPPDSTISISLAPFTPIAGNNELKAYIEWPQDLNQANDTILINAFGFVFSGLPYSDDFENGTGGWISNQINNTIWELGSPTFAPLNTSHSGNNCWDINLNSPYFNFANAILTSPTFDLSNLNIVTLQFWLNYSSESNTDGLFVEYTNDGITWQRLGSIGDPQGTNWYNSTLTSGNQGWSGVNTGWQSCSYIYVAPWGNNYFQCRFRFISDFNLVDAGASIDDISLTGVTSVNEVKNDDNIVIYPNPVNNELTILSTNKYTPLNHIELKSIEGKIVYQEEFNMVNLHTISTTNLTPGIYLLEICKERSERIYKRVIVQH